MVLRHRTFTYNLFHLLNMNNNSHDSVVWQLLDKYFDGPNAKYKLTQHHLHSYSDFIRYRIPSILQDFNSWNNSEVFNGAKVRTTTENIYTGNPNARAHIFVGMNVHDLHNSCCNLTRTSLPVVQRPTRLQLRHQTLEYSKLPNQPIRYITPNEARLRNLNYQHELVADIVIVHHCTLDKKEKEYRSFEFVQMCTQNWHKHYTHIRSLLMKHTLPKTVPELAEHVKVRTNVLVQYVHKHSHITKPEISDVLRNYIQRGISKCNTCEDGVDYVSRMMGITACKYVSMFEDVVLAKIPLMLHSEFCVLRNQPNAFLRDVGECVYEKGGYFIIRGKEKVIISQESYCRSVIQTRSTTLNAPSTAVFSHTHILHKGDSKPIERGQEEVFEASIECANDPRPPVKVVLHYKRMPYYYTGGSVQPNDIKKYQLDIMRKHLPFKGLYITLFNRKGTSRENAILFDVPVFLLFRAMGATNKKNMKEQLSDREIIECILGCDTTGIQQVDVPLASSRALCACEDNALQMHSKCWYTPHEEGDCMFLTFDTVVKLPPHSMVNVQFVSSKLYKKKVMSCEVIDSKTHKDVLVRLPVSDNCFPFDASFEMVSIQGLKGVTQAIASPCRYARRYRATVRKRTKTHCSLAYHSHTEAKQTYDPILYDLLLPALQEGSFAVNHDVAQDMLQRMVNMKALDDQDDQFAELSRWGTTEKLDAVYRSLFTHIHPTQSDENPSHLLRRKQMFLGYMTKRLLFAYLGLDERNTSRDSYKLRRVQLSGEMLSDVFRYEYFQLQNKYKEYIRNGMRQQGVQGTFKGLFMSSVVRTNLFDSIYMTERLQKSFMGRWGSKIANDADQKAYCQELIRLSYYGSLAYLRRVHKELPSTSKPGQKKGTSKAVGPRLLHASQYGLICPVETPDGANIGKIKHLTTFAFVAPQMSLTDKNELMKYIKRFSKPSHTIDSYYQLNQYHKIIIDGNWSYVCPENGLFANKPITRTQLLTPDRLVSTLRLLRRNGLLSPLISISWNISRKEIEIRTQEGRVTRPLLIVENNVPLFAPEYHNNTDEAWLWEELLTGRSSSHEKQCEAKRSLYYELSVRFQWEDKVPQYASQNFTTTIDQLRMLSGVIEYIDTNEIDRALLAMKPEQLIPRKTFYDAWVDKTYAISTTKKKTSPQNNSHHLLHCVGDRPEHTTFRIASTADAQRFARHLQNKLANVNAKKTKKDVSGRSPIFHYTHCELHPSLMLGIMGMLIPFPEHSQAPRNQYSCHQSKQALGLYVSNFRKRLDHANHILHYPERALTGSRYIKYINNERLNYGTNVIVAIMCYGGFNIEDSVLFNKASVDRGLFQSTYFYTEEVTEKDSQNEKVLIGRNFDIQRMYRKYNYAWVDSNTKRQGIIPVKMLNHLVKKDDVLIEAYEEKREPGGEGRSFTDYKRDVSKDGYVDNIFLSDDVRGRRVAKVTLRNIRVPVVGDKFASRSGQKGTLGALIEEEDMPFLGDCSNAFLSGLKPDIILNPHAIPSRMTIGQLFESLSGVIGTKLGKMGDSTPLCSVPGTNPSESLTKLMQTIGLNPYGNQTMYNGNTGEQLVGKVFLGPTYYQRLKQMPEDKYYHRRTGRADMVTRQPIGGRAQGGALKLGEMERDSLLAHGISTFTKEAFNEKSDGFHYKVSRNHGMVHPPTAKDKVNYDHFTPVRRTMDFLSTDEAGGFKEYIANHAMDATDYKTHADIVQKETIQTNEPTSTVNIPFTTRLFSQECEAMGVGVRLMTENSYGTEIQVLGGSTQSTEIKNQQKSV